MSKRKTMRGEELGEKLLQSAHEMKAGTVARATQVTPNEVAARLKNGIRLARYFGTNAQSWLNLQSAYDLRVAEIAAGKEIKKQVQPRAA